MYVDIVIVINIVTVIDSVLRGYLCNMLQGFENEFLGNSSMTFGGILWLPTAHQSHRNVSKQLQQNIAAVWMNVAVDVLWIYNTLQR